MVSSGSSGNASQRPPSSATLRPPSSASHRPPSSIGRPVSSASNRPGSRLSQRPNSRLSRPATRQSSRILPLVHTLITQVTGLDAENDEDNFQLAIEFASKNLEYTSKAAPRVDMSVVNQQINGHVQKALINSSDTLAEALNMSFKILKGNFNRDNDLDHDITTSHLPDHLRFLLALSGPPSQAALSFADSYVETARNPPQPPPELTWKDILAEEPFEGQHWEGAYGLTAGSMVENWETRSGGSSPSLSDLDDESDDLEDSLSSVASQEPEEKSSQEPPTIENQHGKNPAPLHHFYRAEIEDLQKGQYWTPEWSPELPTNRPFDIGDPSTLGPSLRRALANNQTMSIDGPELDRYIYEKDAVREMLNVLQGQKNILLSWTKIDDTFAYTQSKGAPRLMHLTLNSQASMFESFAQTATHLELLRKFVSTILHTAPGQSEQANDPIPSVNRITCTVEAFADAVDCEIRALSTWCTAREEAICRAEGGAGPPIVISLLSLEKSMRDKFSGSFKILLGILRSFLLRTTRSQETFLDLEALAQLHNRMAPAACTALLLNSLFDAIQEHLSMADKVASEVLMRVFVKTAEPVWSMVGRWLKNGMPVQDPSERHANFGYASLDEEFFIEDNNMMLLDTDFWSEGYTLRGGLHDDDEQGPKHLPAFLAHFANQLLRSGKAIGLLRGLGVPSSDDGRVWLSDWRPFRALLASKDVNDAGQIEKSIFSVSSDTLSSLICDELLPHCQATDAMLVKVIQDECELGSHLSAIEDLYMMRRGHAMSHFADVLFSKMDSNQAWSDFHFLNTAFSDVVEVGRSTWIETSLVRLSYRGTKENAVNRTVKALDGVLVEYAVPFPLTYILRPEVLHVYNCIFVFLLQIRRAKSVLEQILVRGVMANVQYGNELKAFYAMRSKLSWFINILLNFLTTYVIHAQSLRFHDELKEASSLDDIIALHNNHMEKIQSRCLLQPHTAALHRAIISILDMCMHFNDCFIAFAGEASTHDISKLSISMKRHRSRRQRRQRRNVVGFSQSFHESSDSSEELDLDDENSKNAPEPSFSLADSFISAGGDRVFHRLDKMYLDLDGLIRFIRRGVESLAGGSGEVAPTFGVLAFALEDWDM